MKRISIYILVLAATICLQSCEEKSIKTYDVADSAVYFESNVTDLSLRGVMDEYKTFKFEMPMFGQICDYDREIPLEFPDSSYNDAVMGEDVEILSASVPAGASKGVVEVRVRNDEELTSRSIALSIGENGYFHQHVKGQCQTRLRWSKDYIRPTSLVWQSWYTFFSHGYSKKYHELMLVYFGDEIENSSHATGARKDPNVTFRYIDWWYSSNRDFYEMVKKHDQENPDSPYMHSDDYMVYVGYAQAADKGTRPEVIPTILSTLNNL